MSWVIVNKETNDVIMETWQKSVTLKVNTKKYKVVPIKEWLCGLSTNK